MNTSKLFLLLACFLIGSMVFAQNPDSAICWSSTVKLRWEDFRGKIPNIEPNDRTSAVCSQSVEVSWFRLKGQDNYNYNVKALFYKYKSWTKDTTAYSLSHEQLHFDIAELYARKIRKSIYDLHKSGESSRSVYSSLIDHMLLKKREMQTKYDYETINGVNTEAQIRWSKKVHDDLEVLKEFSSTEKDCKWVREKRVQSKNRSNSEP